MTIQTVHAKSGCTIYALITDCNNTPIQQTDLSKITYAIYRIVDFGNYLPVEGHQDVEVLNSAISDTLQTQVHTGEEYNFQLLISAKESLPFPERNAEYRVEIAFHDLDGEPHIVPVACQT